MKRALVTGANGFIGRSLVPALEQAGVETVTLNSSDGDVATPETWQSLPAVDTVYHLAGRSFVPDSWKLSQEFMRVNAIGTECALQYCRRHGAGLVMASTYVYGPPRQLPISEDHPVAPNNPYAVSKRMAEELCAFAADQYGLSTTVLRLFNIYGRGQRGEFLIPTIFEQIKAGREIRVKDLTPKRDYLYIADLVTALQQAGSLRGHNLLNIGAGYSLSVAELIAAAQQAAGTQLPIVSENVTRPNEVMDVVADIRRAESALGWKPQWSIQQGFKAMLQPGPEPAL